MTPAALITWRQRQNLSQSAAATAIGCGRRSLQQWEAGNTAIPHYISLACAALALGINPPPEWRQP